MKRKKWFLLLCSMLLLSTGCSRSVADSIKNTDADSTKQAASDSGAHEKDASEASDTAMDDSEHSSNHTTDREDEVPKEDLFSSDFYTVAFTSHAGEELSQDGSKTLLSYDYQTLEIVGDAYGALKTAVANWQKDQTAAFEKTMHEDQNSAAEEADSTEAFYGYYLSSSLKVTRCDNHIFSFLKEDSRDASGPDATSQRNGINFDASTGALLSLKDIAIDYENFSKHAIDHVLEVIQNSDLGTEGLFEDYESIVADSFDRTPWYFSAAGITLIYQPDEIAPNAVGFWEITLPAAEFETQIKETYRIASSYGYAKVPLEEVVSFASASGTTHALKLYNETVVMEDGYEDITPHISLDHATMPVPFADWSCWLEENCYLIRQNSNRTLLALELNFGSDDFATVFLDITNGGIKELGTLDASIHAPGTKAMVLSSRLNVLGTYSAIMAYDISGNEGVLPLETEYRIPFVYHELKTIRELPVTNMAQKEILLPAGTVLRPVATDDQNYLRVKDSSTQEEYTIYFTREDYMIMIDGVDEYQYFEMLPYAG